MVKVFMLNGFSLELCESDTIWTALRCIAEKLDKAVFRIIIIRNTSSLWNDRELPGKVDVSITISHERVERELMKAIDVSDFNAIIVFWLKLQ